jgi:hypothetical protein
MPRPHSEPQPLPSQPPHQQTELHEVVGLFADPHKMEEAVQDLLTNGLFDHADVAILARDRTVREKLGHRIGDSLTAADDPKVPRRNWVEPESRMEGRGALASVLGYLGAITALGLTFASGGAVAAAVGAALVGAGGGAALGAGLGKIVDSRLAAEMQRQVEAGGILLWVHARDAVCEAKAVEMLERHGASHVHSRATSG